MTKQEIIESLKGGLIVSCQTEPKDCIHEDGRTVVTMAKAAKWGGAVAIRSNSPEQVKAIHEAVDLPIIGLDKIYYDTMDRVIMTPTIEHAKALWEAGARIIALEATDQLNHLGVPTRNLIPEIKKELPEAIIFADVDKMRIAIIGGSFDPIHYGHIHMGLESIKQLKVDEVWFMPTKITPLKDRELTSVEDRVSMIKLAIEPYANFKLCTLELEREEKSYTIDTLRELKKRYKHEFYWIIGNDQLEQFDRWKDPEKLVKMAQFVCFDRDHMLTKTSYDIKRLHMECMPVSSSEIRMGNKLNYLPSKVLDYIYANRLYVKEFVASRVPEHRYRHSLSVANLCEEFARNNGLDVNVAYYIGLFHDVCKAMPKDRMLCWIKAICPENEKYAPPVWHGFVGAEVVDRNFYIKDWRIKNAPRF